MTSTSAPLAYLWGEDAYAIDRAADALAGELGTVDEPLRIWRTSAEETEVAADPVPGGPSGESVRADGGATGRAPASATARRRSRLLEQIEERVSVAPLFGGGTLVVVRQPGALLRDAASRARLLALVRQVPLGNGLCFCDLVGSGSDGPAGAGVLSDAVADAGGTVRRFPALTRERLEAWVTRHASELGVSFGAGAARLLTERVGGYVREGDVDRRRQAELASSELEKLALLRPGGVVSRADVDELVPEAIPGSTWAFLDAVASRRTGEASRLAERLLAQAMPMPVLISQLHRRLRELLIVREHLATGARPPELVRRMRLQPYRAQKLAEQATTWAMPELEDALTGLMELDLSSKGIAPDGRPAPLSDARSALAFHVWLAERVERTR